MLVRPPPTVSFAKLLCFALAFFLAGAYLSVDAQNPDGAAGTIKADKAPYVDKLIEGAIAEDQSFSTDEAGPEIGRRSFHFETYMIHRRNDGQNKSTGLGAQVSHRWQTRNYGDWIAQASWRVLFTDLQANGFASTDSRSSVRGSISQRNMPVTQDWWMNNTVGTLRTIGQPVLRSRYRFSLPTSTVLGASTFWQQQSDVGLNRDSIRPRRVLRQGLALSAGRLSRREGQYGFGRRSLNSRVISGSWTRRLDNAWAAGIELIHLRGWDGGPDYSGQSVALEYEPRNKPLAARLQLVRNSNGSDGAWIEGAYQGSIHKWRYSAWDFDPGLSWLDTLLSSGQRGLWLRYDQTDPTAFFGAGVELNQDDPQLAGLPGVRRLRTSGRIGGRADRRRSFGLRWQWQTETPDMANALTQKNRFLSFDLYALRVNKSLRDNIEYSWAQSRANTSKTQIHELTWSREKEVDVDHRWGVTLGAIYENDDFSSRLRPSVSLTWDGRINKDTTYNLWARYARDEGQLTTATTYAASAQLNWQFQPRWRLELRGNYNAIANTVNAPLFGSTQQFDRGHSLWMFLRYDLNWGKSFASGSGGAADITGLVYYDQNGDGIRQPNEAPAPNVRIILDGFQVSQTGPDGRYSFSNISTGSRQLQVDISTVRLPWGFEDKKPITVNLSPRTRQTRDIPLIKIGE